MLIIEQDCQLNMIVYFTFDDRIVYNPSRDRIFMIATRFLNFQTPLKSYTEIVTSLQASNETLNGQCAVFDSDCDGNLVTSNSFYYGFFIAGQALNGIGAQALWTLGAVYIDENFSQSGAPMALGLFEGMGVLGPAVGFLLGGVFLSFWIDGGDAPADFTTDDELWIGNWWIGFVIGGCLALLTGILIALLPATLSTAKANQKTRRQEFHKGQTEMTTENTGKIRNDIKLFWIILRPYRTVYNFGSYFDDL